jgi:hypothetical protein
VATRQNSFGQPIGPAVDGWSPRPRPQRTDMLGRYCRLEPVEQRHEAELFAAYMEAPDGRDWTYLFSERPENAADFRAYLSKLEKSEDPLHFTIVDTEAGKCVGTAALMRIEPTHGVIEVGSITFAPRLKTRRH